MTGGLTIPQMNDLVEGPAEDEGAARVTGPDPHFVDYYELLNVHATADLAEIKRRTEANMMPVGAWQILKCPAALCRTGSLGMSGDHEGRIFFDSLKPADADEAAIPADNTERPALRGVPAVASLSGELEKSHPPQQKNWICT